MDNIFKHLALLGQKYQAEKIVLFGSRARGDHRERSDIDIAVYGIEETKQAFFCSDIDDIPTLLSFDVIFITDRTDKKLTDNIKKDGKIIYEQV